MQTTLSDGESLENTPFDAEPQSHQPELLCHNGKRSRSDQNKLKWKCYKNVIIVSVCFCLLFCAYETSEQLQSTVNKDGGLGTNGLAVIYSCFVLSGLLLPPIVIDKMGCKWAIAVSIVPYAALMAVYVYPIIYLVYLASIAVGLSAGVLWSAKSVYVTTIVTQYASSVNSPPVPVLHTAYGIFFSFYHIGNIVGTAVTSVVIKEIKKNISQTTGDICGAKFCPSDQEISPNLARPPDTQVYALFGTFLVAAVVAFVIVAVFLDKIDKTHIHNIELDKANTLEEWNNADKCDVDVKIPRSKPEKHSACHLLVKTSKHIFTSRIQQLMIPITFYSGLADGFFAAEMTKSYISCQYGVWTIGYYLLCHASVTSASCFIAGQIASCTKRTELYFMFGIIHFGILVSLRFWIPTFGALFGVVIVWAIADGIMSSYRDVIYSHLFPEKLEESFSTLHLVDALGYLVAYAYSNSLCTDVKIYIAIVFLVLGFIGYGVVLCIKSNSL